MTSVGQTTQTLTDRTRIHQDALDMLHSLNLEEGDITPIPKPPTGTSGRRIMVNSNVYQVKTPNQPIFRYDITISGRTSNGKEVDFTKKSGVSTVIADRVHVCRDAFRMIVDSNPGVFGTDRSSILYDLQSTLYSVNELVMDDNEVPLAVDLERLRNSAQYNAIPQSINSITVRIKKAKSNRVDLGDLRSIYNVEENTKNRSILNIVELIVNQYPMMHENEFLTLRGATSYMMKGTDYGMGEEPLDRGHTKYLASGVRKSAFFMEGYGSCKEPPRQCQSVGLMIETKRTPFHSSISLTQFFSGHSATTAHFHEFVRGSLGESARQHLARVVRKLSFTLTHRPNTRVEVLAVARETAADTIIQQTNQSIAHYFKERYKITLMYPYAHLINYKIGGHLRQMPAELMVVADNQTCTVDQLDAKDKAEMIKKCALRPDYQLRDAKVGAAAIHMHDSEHLAASGFKLSKDTIKFPARVLDKPSFIYRDNNRSQVEGGETKWQMLPFIRGSRNGRFCLFLIGTRSDTVQPINTNDLQMFARTLQDGAKRFGMVLGECIDIDWIFEEEVEDRIQKAEQDGCGLVYFISPDCIKRAHDTMKSAEHVYKIATQDIKSNTLRKVIQRGSSTLENILFKTNLKLGGLNYSVRIPHPDAKREFEHNLIIGISSSQPGAKTRADQVKKSNKWEKPGVLGFCANICEDCDTFAGDFYYINAYRSEIYDRLREVSARCVQDFIENRGHSPVNVFFYYAGIAEGQYDNVLSISLPLIKQGIRDSNQNIDIPLCLIAVQKVTNVRIYPEKFPAYSGRDCVNMNVPPGTVVDERLANPHYSEFYLTPHSSPIGTARCPRFTILVNEPNYNMDIVQNLTMGLCFETQIVAKATALPTPIEVAENYANRGRHVFQAVQFDAERKKIELPRHPDGELDLDKLSEKLNYAQCPELRKRRINA